MDSIEYYDKYAAVYFDNTVDLDMSGILDDFLEKLPLNADVLDLGCGSGRDSLYLEKAGCYVTPLDGSEEMCKLAEIHTGKEVLNIRFEQIDFDEVFDGIWACASLLHVQESDMADVIRRVMISLKKKGILYMSFKYGDISGYRSERYFNCFTEQSMIRLLQQCPELEIIRIWTTEDIRKNHENKTWLNVMARRK